ncbi:MAG: polymer-forming cytoskeletal protein [Desulfobacterales bacterium]
MKKKRHFSIIQQNMAVKGNVAVDGKMVIGGTLNGTLSASEVVISKSGNVVAGIRAHRVTIAGRFRGEILAGDVTIAESGICIGDIKCMHLILDPGGNLNATVAQPLENGLADVNAIINYAPRREKVAVTGK